MLKKRIFYWLGYQVSHLRDFFAFVSGRLYDEGRTGLGTCSNCGQRLHRSNMFVHSGTCILCDKEDMLL